MTVIPRDHPNSRKDISDNALKVLYRLNNSGFQAYLVGGGVRDITGKTKDFDIATIMQHLKMYDYSATAV